jgi:hypothetical protein
VIDCAWAPETANEATPIAMTLATIVVRKLIAGSTLILCSHSRSSILLTQAN